jgi:6-phosphogluconate dehydrogenase
MKLGLVGLGRMGDGIAGRLRGGGHTVIGYDADPALTEAGSLAEMVLQLEAPCVVWVMVPAGEATQTVLDELQHLLSPGDVIVDGGNSYYRDTLRRARELTAGLRFLDCGTSGGLWGRDAGYCLMAGGDRSAFDLIEPVLTTLAAPNGYAYLGPAGAGHFAKMVHNGIEYGMLQAYAEGFALLQACEYDYDLASISSLWQNGSVVRSWLLELAERAFRQDAGLEALRGYVDDSGEGRWIVQEAIERAVPLSVIGESLFRRFASREDDSFAMRFIAAMRNEFGGHGVRGA